MQPLQTETPGAVGAPFLLPLGSAPEGAEWLQAIITSALDCIIAIDQAGRILEFNKAAEQTFGYSREAALGQSMAELIVPARFREAHHQGMVRYRTTGQAVMAGRRIEVTAMRADGSEFPAELTIIPVHPSESPFFTAYLRDISTRKEAEREKTEHIQQLRRILLQTVHSVSKTIETRDPYTAGHQSRVSELGAAIARKLGLEARIVEGVQLGGLIHDIGKIAVPAEILTRPGLIDRASYAVVKNHCETGYEITKDVEFPWPIADIIRQHHERLDGSGYPQGLRGDRIILEARIIGVADVVEAIHSQRPYRESLGLASALEEIRENAGVLYDPDVVAACLDLIESGEFQFDDHPARAGKA